MTFGHNPAHPQAKKARASSVETLEGGAPGEPLPYWQQVQVNLIIGAAPTLNPNAKRAIVRALQFAYRKGYTKGYGDGTNIFTPEGTSTP